MTRFRPCIDLHSGQVKQIVGGTLTDVSAELKTNHVSTLPAGHFAKLYKENGLTGAHVIMLGPGNMDAAQEALSEWKGGFQVGGGVTEENAMDWINFGAEKVIITSYLFPDGKFSMDRLQGVLSALQGDKNKLVIDLSCRRVGSSWFVAMNKWQKLTDTEVNEGELRGHPIESMAHLTAPEDTIKMLEPYCSEFLIHAADNEGLQRGIDEELVRKLAQWCSIPVTYAGGGKSVEDLDKVQALSHGKVDLTIGSALDVFGGTGAKFTDCVEWNKRLKR
ncbi:MAG: Histidine biosynthesis bifunctional protein hisB [Sarea resinae]|nr:MAG: Histidine biosynthesis bifunctional protein hisB [Sarea resinae]